MTQDIGECAVDPSDPTREPEEGAGEGGGKSAMARAWLVLQTPPALLAAGRGGAEEQEKGGKEEEEQEAASGGGGRIKVG